MNSNDPRIARKQINEQQVLIPTEAAWEELQHEPFIDQIKIFSTEVKSGDLIEYYRKFTTKYQELSLGLVQVGVRSPAWQPIVLLSISDGQQRVHLERLTCPVCDWQGQSANPMTIDLYIGVPDKKVAIEIASRYPVLPCPRCGSALPQHPIWLEPRA